MNQTALLQMHQQKRETNALSDNFENVLATLTMADINTTIESIDIRLFAPASMKEMCLMLDLTGIGI